ncbi:acyltransferase [Mycolicibacterium flavescens]|uniref:acyltransferase n=1 Tax=Mycolicibacterium flavescens TaxID=1776 RepID=UPI000A946FC7|nr:acyltransferase [Mycolicibacterium flavescens]
MSPEPHAPHVTADDVARRRAAAPKLKVPPAAPPTGLRRLRDRLSEQIFNLVLTHVPSHTVRQGFLRACGATIGERSAIMRGTEVYGIAYLTIGDETAIGWRCVLDARGGLCIGDNVTVASDVHFLGTRRDIDRPGLRHVPVPTVVGDYAWIASRAMVLPAHIKRGAVVAGQATVMRDIEECEVVGGDPLKVIGQRDPEALAYTAGYRPLFS